MKFSTRVTGVLALSSLALGASSLAFASQSETSPGGGRGFPGGPGGKGGPGGFRGGSEHSSPFWKDGSTLVGLSEDSDDRLSGVDIAQNGSIFAAGYRGATQGEDRVMTLAKFTKKAELDPSFGTAGVATFDFSPYQGTPDDPATPDVNEADPAIEQATGVAIREDGKLVVLGRATDPDAVSPDNTTGMVWVVFRVNADGSQDMSFGQGGRTLVNVGDLENELPWSLQMDDQERLYLSGHGTAPVETGRTDRDRYVVRLTEDGDLDASYGPDGTGFVSLDVYQGSRDNQRHARILPGGELIASGYTNLAGRNQVVLVKLDADGAADTTFSGDGVVRLTPFPLGMAECYDTALLSDGSYVTTGYGRLYSGEAPPTGEENRGTDLVSFHVTADGSFDPFYGFNGGIAYNVANGNDRGRTVLALPDDMVLHGGTGIPGEEGEDAMLLLTTPWGQLSRNFDKDKHKLYDFGGEDEEFVNLKLAPSGKFVVAVGHSRLGTQPNEQSLLHVIPVPWVHRR